MSERLEIVQNMQSALYTHCGLNIQNFFPQKEGAEYHAHTFTLLTQNGLFRIAKKTPTKTGWFVTIWKRGDDNIIAPYESTDAIDFVVIGVSDTHNMGQFIFPKSLLLKKNIFSANSMEGKRAIRVYTPWDQTTSLQAATTQKWQSQFFVDFASSTSEQSRLLKKLYSI